MMNRRGRGGDGTVETGGRPSNHGHLYRMFDRRNNGEEFGGVFGGLSVGIIGSGRRGEEGSRQRMGWYVR